MVNLNWLKFWQKEPIIEFFCHEDFENVIPKPTAAGKNIPNWYKKLPTEVDIVEKDEFGGDFKTTIMTAKACLPMLDAMTLGFTIPLSADLKLVTNHNCSQIIFKNSGAFPAAEFHNSVQVGGHNGVTPNNGNPIKFINRWIIKTAPGWSTLFIPPINSFDNPHFTCLSGFVDTDVYPKEINFPAIWHTPNFSGTIRAGTPLVTAIPIKRDTIQNQLHIRKMNKKDFETINTMTKIQSSREHYYTKELRVKK